MEVYGYVLGTLVENSDAKGAATFRQILSAIFEWRNQVMNRIL